MSDDAGGHGDQRLAAVVAKPRSQAAIKSLQAEGVYDDTRSITEWTADSVAVPVTAPPQETQFREVVRQVGERRLRTLDDHLRERGWTDAEIAAAPGSWAVLGSVVLVDIGDSPRPSEVGEALLALHGEAETVLARHGISGEHREPSVEVIAGDGDTETIHTEHGTRYAMDLAEVMFSPGNKAERARMGDVVAADERVLDMFAGIGYFTLPMARAGANVTAVERNPTAFRFLVENVMLNDVDERVHPYRADCREVIPGFAEEGRADRVVMGYYEAHEYLGSALDALAPGGVLHMHEATPDALVFDRPIERLEAAAAEADRAVEVLDTRRVKEYSEGVAHVVVDARVE
ncbi:SAM-dependent methyltransferase [Haloarcula taiwanensis]|uniref:tRNA(Phe) (4-demethylwyosine(37)-C(7)) aminocarboxypropyltransferase n=1 Tax=Haloarcula taiwanensis TaxID=1932004 RepID=A0A2H4ZUI6_9EURY|nr:MULTISPECIES: class I SAM-dependent methyltransferase family protein [Haloarcula]AUG46135.1 SAM-dependent methyltransferase [Haloarcula taiwanensis]RLM40267.1 class I SAM-dependent methyltransferase family protein [Haloarcula sp. Atlit-120R]RLM48296.1 class I SAM-dependent methyltransferase family protein [Haloarcula sp. Atlit-47R]RLM96684.1 class I SAM-dependent methyltransferase family protein [Haloarcula sp. Atlit-7R]